MTARDVRRETQSFEVLGGAVRRQIRYCCAEHFATAWVPDRFDELAGNEMREHLLDEHTDELPYGRCGEDGCARITDHFRMEIAGGARVWLCEIHTPTMAEMGVE